MQTDIKSALSFASLAQVGLIVAEIGLGLAVRRPGPPPRPRLPADAAVPPCADAAAGLPPPGERDRRTPAARQRDWNPCVHAPDETVAVSVRINSTGTLNRSSTSTSASLLSGFSGGSTGWNAKRLIPLPAVQTLAARPRTLAFLPNNLEMNLFEIPWLELALVAPIFGAALAWNCRDSRAGWRIAFSFSSVVLICSVLAWTGHWSGVAPGGVTPNDVVYRIVGGRIVGLDDINAPLVPFVALLHLLIVAGTTGGKAARLSFAGVLALEAIQLATFAAIHLQVFAGLLALATLVPFLELSARRRPTRLYAMHMGLFVSFLAIGMAVAHRDGFTTTLAWVPLTMAILIRCGVAPPSVDRRPLRQCQLRYRDSRPRSDDGCPGRGSTARPLLPRRGTGSSRYPRAPDCRLRRGSGRGADRGPPIHRLSLHREHCTGTDRRLPRVGDWSHGRPDTVGLSRDHTDWRCLCNACGRVADRRDLVRRVPRTLRSCARTGSLFPDRGTRNGRVPGDARVPAPGGAGRTRGVG